MKLLLFLLFGEILFFTTRALPGQQLSTANEFQDSFFESASTAPLAQPEPAPQQTQIPSKPRPQIEPSYAEKYHRDWKTKREKQLSELYKLNAGFEGDEWDIGYDMSTAEITDETRKAPRRLNLFEYRLIKLAEEKKAKQKIEEEERDKEKEGDEPVLLLEWKKTDDDNDKPRIPTKINQIPIDSAVQLNLDSISDDVNSTMDEEEDKLADSETLLEERDDTDGALTQQKSSLGHSANTFALMDLMPIDDWVRFAWSQSGKFFGFRETTTDPDDDSTSTQ